ncbi:MAG: hypothetical protein ACYC4E_01590 [Carboxydocellales bacterium]
MNNVGLVSLLLLAGIVLGMACVVLSMWFLLSLLQRQGLLPAVSLGRNNPDAPEYNLAFRQASRQQEQVKSVQQVEQPEAGHLREEPVVRPEFSKLIPGGQNQETFNEELMAAMAATLCAYGANHQKYRIKQVRVVT